MHLIVLPHLLLIPLLRKLNAGISSIMMVTMYCQLIQNLPKRKREPMNNRSHGLWNEMAFFPIEDQHLGFLSSHR
ncbi:hypothetical protein P3S67_010903 [Capsicum chacoense]